MNTCTQTHTDTFTRTNMYTHTHMHTHTHTHMHTHTHTHTYTYTYTHTHTHTHTHIHTRTHIHHTHSHTHTHTHDQPQTCTNSQVTFSADGTQVLAVESEGKRYKLDALPNDPTLLDTLSKHKVDVTVLPAQQAAASGDLARSLLFPALLFGGLVFLSRRGQEGGGGGPGGMGGPMDVGRSGAKVYSCILHVAQGAQQAVGL